MPIFEYRCGACARRFEALLSHRDEAPPCCPKCGSPRVEKMLSTFAVTRGGAPASPSWCPREDCGRCRQ
jgi:putative FmdB family regulatory protein